MEEELFFIKRTLIYSIFGKGHLVRFIGKMLISNISIVLAHFKKLN